MPETPTEELRSAAVVLETDAPMQADAIEAAVGSLNAPAVTNAEAVVEIRRVVDAGIERIQSMFLEKDSLDQFREKQIDALHAELQEYKADIVGKSVRPVLQSLIRLHDDLGKVLDALRVDDPAALDPRRLVALLEGFHEDVELALDHNGVTTFRSTGEEFDPRRQKAIRTVPAGEQNHTGRIAERVRPGFEQGEAVLEKERVAVYVLPEPAVRDEGEKS
jgi:molecular chaperone GrpE